MNSSDIQQRLQKIGLKDRPSQLEMIEQVYQALKKKQILCIEAPTGTGKTLSYLVAGYYSKKKDQKLIISTATIALQEQLLKKDLPLLQQIVGSSIRYAIAKGRRNYLCLAKLDEEDATGDMFDDRHYMTDIKKQVSGNAWNGDRESLKTTVKDREWFALTTDSAGCSNGQCAFFNQCFFFKARSRVHSADIIISNHSLLLADLELGCGVLLPEPDNNLYVFDECHHLPERSVSHFAKSSQLMASIDWLNQVNITVQRAINSKIIPHSWHQKTNNCTLLLVEAIKKLKSQLDVNSSCFHDDNWRILDADLPQFEICKEILTQIQALSLHIDTLYNTVENELEQQQSIADNEKKQILHKSTTQLKFLLSRINYFLATWKLFLHQQQSNEAPIARWFEKITAKGRQGDYICHCSPINVSEKLKQLFWNKIKNGAVLCSATIRSLDSFDNFLRKTGLKQLDNINTAIMPAIFDYQRSVIFIPKMTHDSSSNAEKHRLEVINLLPELILSQSGTLVLFTSHYSMNETYKQLSSNIVADILMQGQHSKSTLITMHQRKIDSGARSIIFGLTSFAEGVDLPANYCQHVIIHKLPFAVPSSPIELTRSEWLEKHKMNPFMMATLPETAIKLTQYVGRLIRQEADLGIVTILDRRLYSKGYGKQLLQSLPPFTRLIASDLAALKQHEATKTLFA